jgi:hypothetical protein
MYSVLGVALTIYVLGKIMDKNLFIGYFCAAIVFIIMALK